MRMTFDGKVRQYHPASGLDLYPGDHDYPDDATADLLVAGLKKAKDPVLLRKKAVTDAVKAALAATEGSAANGEE